MSIAQEYKELLEVIANAQARVKEIESSLMEMADDTGNYEEVVDGGVVIVRPRYSRGSYDWLAIATEHGYPDWAIQKNTKVTINWRGVATAAKAPKPVREKHYTPGVQTGLEVVYEKDR